MGTRREDRRHRPVILSIEPLEERFLLSGSGAPVAASVSALSPPSVAVPPSAPPQIVLGQIMLQKETVTGLGILAGAVASLPGVLTQQPSTAAAPVPATYHSDDDGDSWAIENEEAGNHANQPSVLPFLFTNQNINCPILGGANGTAEQTPPQGGASSSLLVVLSTAGFGVAATPVVPIPVLSTVSPISGEQTDKSAPEKGRNPIPELPNSHPFLVAPPAEATPRPTPASSLGIPFADLLPMDGEALQRSADAFFEKLAKVSEQWQDCWVIQKLSPWVIVAGMVAYQWLQLRRLRSGTVPESEDNEGVGPAVFLAGDER